MRIIGRGFIARHMTAVGDRHPHVTLLAAGVSSTRVTDPAEFAREAALVKGELARAADRGGMVVFLSTASSSLYGVRNEPAREDAEPHPLDGYGQHKLSLEEEVRTAGADWLILRLSHVVGVGQREHQLFPSLLRQMRSGSVSLHLGASRDLIDVTDVRTALDSLLRQKNRNEVVNVASGILYPMEKVVAGIESRLRVTVHKNLIQAPPSGTSVSIDKLRRLLPVWPFSFGPDYTERLLDAYTESYEPDTGRLGK
ncbi:NAD-dependent epimerase/dehydratase family protein [Streptomyces sp. BHT-5-2]|uniref:NAD-dependent epimerase/dehydratase family protein n=1 Tax=Streptomyces sp. BHT-5-2 TaxID=2866715 RepID=UPI001C8EA6E2|nr:NAD-dependent epimerase/dehydratase family protein [Streptomyces sp. BHT-5-2]QZL06402.1 NAD-dependent epimerase/dehydratase family protein [Streptomyces sp. BHT-5-2]